MPNIEVEIARLRSDVRLPKYHTSGSACFDIEAAEEVVIHAGAIADIPTGLVFRLPPEHVMIVQPRSSSPKFGYIMPHSVGILDSDYCGPKDELFIRLKNVTNRKITIEKHQRIAQGYVMRLPKIRWKELKAKQLGKRSRGGFGSTGKS